MVSSRLLQTSIIVAAFITMFTAFQVFAFSLIYFLAQVFFGDSRQGEYYIQNLLVYLVLFLVTLLVLRKSKDIADWLARKSDYNANMKIELKYSSIFSIILVSLAVFALISRVPMLLTAWVQDFRSRVSSDLELFEREAPQAVNWIQLIAEVTLYILIIYYAKPISKWFSGHFGDDTDTFSFEDKSTGELKNETSEP